MNNIRKILVYAGLATALLVIVAYIVGSIDQKLKPLPEVFEVPDRIIPDEENGYYDLVLLDQEFREASDAFYRENEHYGDYWEIEPDSEDMRDYARAMGRFINRYEALADKKIQNPSSSVQADFGFQDPVLPLSSVRELSRLSLYRANMAYETLDREAYRTHIINNMEVLQNIRESNAHFLEMLVVYAAYNQILARVERDFADELQALYPIQKEDILRAIAIDAASQYQTLKNKKEARKYFRENGDLGVGVGSTWLETQPYAFHVHRTANKIMQYMEQIYRALDSEECSISDGVSTEYDRVNVLYPNSYGKETILWYKEQSETLTMVKNMGGEYLCATTSQDTVE